MNMTLVALEGREEEKTKEETHLVRQRGRGSQAAVGPRRSRSLPTGAPGPVPRFPKFPSSHLGKGKTNTTGHFDAGVVFLSKVARRGSTKERQVFEHGLTDLCWRLKVIHV